MIVKEEECLILKLTVKPALINITGPLSKTGEWRVIECAVCSRVTIVPSPGDILAFALALQFTLMNYENSNKNSVRTKL